MTHNNRCFVSCKFYLNCLKSLLQFQCQPLINSHVKKVKLWFLIALAMETLCFDPDNVIPLRPEWCHIAC
jgi:hypothetical protein